MKIKITKTHTTEEEIEVELPYYFEHDCGGDEYYSVYYGKIEETRTTKINRSGNFSRGLPRFEIEVDYGKPSGTYLAPEYKGARVDYEKVKAEALEMLSGA